VRGNYENRKRRISKLQKLTASIRKKKLKSVAKIGYLEGGFTMQCPKCGMNNFDWVQICGRCGNLLFSPKTLPQSSVGPVAEKIQTEKSMSKPQEKIIEIQCIYDNCFHCIIGKTSGEVYDKAKEHMEEAHRVNFNNMAVNEEIGGRISDAIKFAMGKEYWEEF
jgi:predicted small metal-binding protein